METKNKVLICFALCFVLLLVGLVIAAAVAVGVWVALNPQPEFSISINSTLPSGQAFSNGFIVLEFSLPSGINLQESVIIYLDGIERFSFTTFPRNLQIPTQGLADGNHTVSIVAISQGNRRGYGEIIILVEDPKLILVSLDYPRETYPGTTLTITAEISGTPSHFVANFTSLLGQTTLSTSNIQTGPILTVSISIPANLAVEERVYSIPLVVYSTDGSILMVPGIEIFFQAGQTSPFTIEEGIIDMRSFPTDSTTDSTLNFTLPPNFEVSITTGQSVEIPIEVGNSNVSEVLVGFEGFGQHFIIPVTSLQNQNTNSNQRRSTRQANSANEVLTVVIVLPTGSISGGNTIVIEIRLRSSVGGLGPIQSFQCVTSHSQTGTLHVRLTWYTDVDMDLHVVDPNDEELFYSHRTSTGQPGFLDLDSNAGCSLDYIEIENVYYSLAISGEYTVRIDLWSSCSVTGQINFDVLVDGCGISRNVNGSFNHTEADGGSSGSGREVLVFNVTCHTNIVDGTVSYRTLLTGNNPLGSIVRVVDDEGNVHGTSQVVRDPGNSNRGVFSVSYEPNDVNATVHVEFLSSNNRINVVDHSGNTHVYRVSESIIPYSNSTAFIDVVILLSDGSGAFHIMVTLTRMLPTYLAYGGLTTDYPFTAVWGQAEYASGRNYIGSYVDCATKEIHICGHPSNPDELDDTILLYLIAYLALSETEAVLLCEGCPYTNLYTSPCCAFPHGFAIYLGQRVIGNLMYCDGIFCVDLEDLHPSILGTSNDLSSGDISIWVVASAAYRLDAEIGLGAIMAYALQNQLLSFPCYSRLGCISAVDFSDMVSQVVCPIASDTATTDLLEEYQLNWIDEPGFCDEACDLIS